MRHPALTRFFAAFLAVVSAITLISGGICVKKAADTREKQNTELTRLTEKWEEAKELDAQLASMREEYESLDLAHAELNEQYGKEMLSFRKDLAIYTATEAGLKQAAEQIEEGYKGLRMGWIAHDNGEKALDEAEAQFRPGYEQYLAGKAALAEGWQMYYLAEAYVNSGADIELQSALIEAGGGLSHTLSASMATLESTLNSPPTNPETGEIDTEALAAQLSAQSAAILEELAASEELKAAAQTALDSAEQFAEANAATLQELIENGFSQEEVQGYINQQSADLQARISSAQQLLGELEGAEDSQNELKAKLESLRDNAAEIAQGDLSESELVMTLAAMLGTTSSLLSDAADILDGAAQMMGMLGDLPAMKAQLEAAQAALLETEPMLLAALEGFAEGRRQLDAAKETLIIAEAQLIKGKQALEEKQAEQKDTRAELDRRKTELENNSRTLAEQAERLEAYTEKKDHFNNLRFALLANEGISAHVRDGDALLDAAEAQIVREGESMQREYRFRLTAAILMLAAALFGVLTVMLAFRDKLGAALHAPAALAFLLAAAAEGVSYAAGRGMIYTVFFVGLFALGVTLLNLKKA